MSIYCTYLTTYFGSKLPMFYIGSSSVEKINKGYHGSVSSKKYKPIWKQELKENPNLFKTKIISYHNSKEESLIKEEKLQRALNVIRSSMYINLVFARKGFDISNPDIKKYIDFSKSPEHRAKLSKLRKGIKTGPCPSKGRPGKLNGMYNKTHTEESMNKLREKRALKTDEQNKKSYSREKSLEEIKKISDNRLLRRICRIKDHKEMDVSNFNRYLKEKPHLFE